MPAPRPRKISDIMPKLQNVAQTSKFLVKFALPPTSVRTFMRQKGINDRFISDNIGLLCSDAVLPGSALASLNTAGDFQGVIERFAHTRNFTQINLEFYVDNDYKSLKFLEHWMEYITGASTADPVRDSYHFRIRYPEDYKSNDTRIVKFEANHSQFLEYRFIGMFPLSLNSTRVSYQNSQVLKATCAFSFDRYVCGESSSLARALGIDMNKKRRGRTDDGISRNTLGFLNEVQSGLPLLNEDVAYTLSSDFTRVRTGAPSTRYGFGNSEQLSNFTGT